LRFFFWLVWGGGFLGGFGGGVLVCWGVFGGFFGFCFGFGWCFFVLVWGGGGLGWGGGFFWGLPAPRAQTFIRTGPQSAARRAVLLVAAASPSTARKVSLHLKPPQTKTPQSSSPHQEVLPLGPPPRARAFAYMFSRTSLRLRLDNHARTEERRRIPRPE